VPRDRPLSATAGRSREPVVRILSVSRRRTRADMAFNASPAAPTRGRERHDGLLVWELVGYVETRSTAAAMSDSLVMS